MTAEGEGVAPSSLFLDKEKKLETNENDLLEDSGSPPFSFATDCLGNFQSVRRKVSRCCVL